MRGGFKNFRLFLDILQSNLKLVYNFEGVQPLMNTNKYE